MRPNKLKQLFKDKQTAYIAWQQFPAPLVGEMLGHTGVDAVCLDLQHSPIFVEQAVPIMQAISATPAHPIVRVSANNFQEINRVLDNGAYGVIAPLINTAHDAREFMRACLYAPLGERSWGAPRGLLYGGDDYFAHANTEILKLAMIETQQGLDNLEAILDVPGLDGIFIGPSDLSIALVGNPAPLYDQGKLKDALQYLRRVSASKGKYAGIFCPTLAMAQAMKALRYDMVVVGPDSLALKTEIAHRVSALRG
jgi:4-hydroxy-2-oxoheptanedioate aldolase